MRFRYIDKEHGNYGVRRLCRLLQVSASGYYAWRRREPSHRQREDERLLQLVRLAVKAGRGTYGYRRVHPLVKAQKPCGRERIARLMREHGLSPNRKRRYVSTTQSNHGLAVAPNIVAQRFEAQATNQIWLADVTYIRTDQGWLYLAAIVDLFSRFIVGWSMARYHTTDLTGRALTMALLQRQPAPGLIHHSDRGVQYASQSYQTQLHQAGIIPSMSRRGNAYDNAPIESFFSRLKNELIHHRHYATRAAARSNIFDYIELFYNRQRLHSALGYRSPLQFEALNSVP